MKETDQQLDIIDFPTKGHGRYLRVNAFAGTGKTTVLEKIIQRYTDKTFLYLVFGKAMSEEAKKRFANMTNVTVSTVNSLAYQGTRTALNLRGVRANYKVAELKNFLKIKSYDTALLVYKVFDSFCNSAYQDINNKIVETLINDNNETLVIYKQSKGVSITDITSGILSMWNSMYDNRLDIVHNFYLKYFHLNIDDLKKYLKYDFVLLDECQDTNEITLDVFNKLNGFKIIVGDKWQQIYGFRGTINAMDNFTSADKQLYLSRTFRFNNEIASKANFLLNNILGEEESIISHFPDKMHPTKTKCIITRTNSGIINQFVTKTEMGQIVKTLRDPDDIFALPLSLYYFLFDRHRHKDKITHKWLNMFNGRADIKEYATVTNDIELMTALKLVEDYGSELINIHLNAKGNRKKKKVDVILTTAHTCKGLEWDEVSIHDDFPDLTQRIALVAKGIEDFQKQIKEKSAIKMTQLQKVVEECNLFYVAITRAICKINISVPNGLLFDLTMEQIDDLITAHRAALKDK
jgi:superfamily I DNA/RNA helicase